VIFSLDYGDEVMYIRAMTSTAPISPRPDPMPRGIDPFRTGGHQPQQPQPLPSTSTDGLRLVYSRVGTLHEMWHGASVWVDDQVTMARWTVAILRLYFEISGFLTQKQEAGKMQVLITTMKVLKLLGVAVGTGGFLSGMLSPETAALIAGASYVGGNALYFIADWMDDRKINKSVQV